MAASERGGAEPKSRSLFDLPPGFFDVSRLLSPSDLRLGLQPPSAAAPLRPSPDGSSVSDGARGAASRWTCNMCRAEFESLQDQRAHFQSDLHRLNVKLSIAGKNTIKEEDFDELVDDPVFKDFDVSSISGSEDELEKISNSSGKVRDESKQKLYFHLQSGDTVSIWKCLLLNESEDFALENNSKTNLSRSTGCMSHMEEEELFARLKYLVREPREKTCLRTVLLVSGGHFAGCVFDGNSIIAHKTFHRYVVRAKAGKKQSSKDSSGKAAHSAGSSLRRHNEAALKKEIQELLVTWKPYISSSSCIFIYAPSKNRQLLFDKEKTDLSISDCVVRYIPFTVRRPTLKEAKRIYNLLTYMTYELNENATLEEDFPIHTADEGKSNQQSDAASLGKNFEIMESFPASCLGTEGTGLEIHSKGDTVSLLSLTNEATPLHEAAKSGNPQLTLELLEQGLDPCLKDERGRTPYMLAKEKEVRNIFRRFMALNLDKWDWHAASVPSPLTKEMEDSQATKQAEKVAKRKAKAKELKILRKAKEKAQQAQSAQSQNASTVLPQVQEVVPVSELGHKSQSNGRMVISNEEEQKKALAAEREKRAAAAERRIAALNARPNTTPSPSISETKGQADEPLCSCCNASLAGKVPFHRYNYKYCSTSCMYVHKEMLEDG